MILSIVKSMFRNERQYKLFLVLSLTTLFDCLLVFYRMYHTDFAIDALDTIDAVTGTRGIFGTFFFLIWNLFLAWIPYWIALALDFHTRYRDNPSIFKVGFLIVMWLLFFPNAPYIVTDLLHFRYSTGIVPYWYDLMLLVSFAWTGLMLGYCSLFEIQRFFETYFSKTTAWIFIVSAIWLGSFGVYMGRYQRWNSWDAFTHPFRLVRMQVHILTNPFEYLNTLGVAVVLGGFMLLGYMTLSALRKV
jgi:uncharacterized membrane protein